MSTDTPETAVATTQADVNLIREFLRSAVQRGDFSRELWSLFEKEAAAWEALNEDDGECMSDACPHCGAAVDAVTRNCALRCDAWDADAAMRADFELNVYRREDVND